MARLVLAGFLNVAASTIEPWRLAPDPEPAATLVVGGPVTSLPEPPAAGDDR